MSNILTVAATVGTESTDQTVDSTGQVLLFLTDDDGGYSAQDAQVNVTLKAASGQYMRQGAMNFANPSFFLQLKPGTIFRVKRISGTVGVDAQGVVQP